MGAEEHFLRKEALIMESKRTYYHLSGFLFSVLALVFLPWGCDKKESEKKEDSKVEAEAAEKKREEMRKKVEADTKTREDSRTGITWVEIKGGNFQMGSETGLENEKPVRKVNINTVWMAKTQVTVAQYKKCVEAKKCSAPLTGPGQLNWDQSGRDDHPVNGVNWDQARDYCRWAGGRLPSEAEWEYVAKSRGKPFEYPWGKKEPTCDLAVMDDDGEGCGKGTTWPVCSKPKGNTEQGLCDMAGNVWEWVEDDYHGSYDCDENPKARFCEKGGKLPSDGSAWVDSPRGRYRLLRGGGFNNGIASMLRVESRNVVDPTLRSDYAGFRCAMDAQ